MKRTDFLHGLIVIGEWRTVLGRNSSLRGQRGAGTDAQRVQCPSCGCAQSQAEWGLGQPGLVGDNRMGSRCPPTQAFCNSMT